MHGNKKVRVIDGRNSGESPLFEYITYCLAGIFYPGKAPAYIRLFNNEEQITYYAIPTTLTPNFGIGSDGTSSYSYVVLTFNVASTALKPNSLNTLSFNTLKIYNKENINNASNPSATLELQDAESVTPGSNLIVAWKMTIQNA